MNYSFITVTGGARSGKSSFAEELSLEINRRYWKGSRIGYIATGEVMDDEFKGRIEKHRERRGDEFVTIEEPLDLISAIRKSAMESRVIMVECFATWLGNVFHYKSGSVEAEVEGFISELKELTAFRRPVNRGAGFIGTVPEVKNVDYTERYDERVVIFVTNEVGCGIVPAEKINRFYRDMLGILNTGAGTLSEHVFSCIAGIPVKIG